MVLPSKREMLTVSCRDVGMDCDYVCKGETEQEIMKNAEKHAVEDHHYKLEEIMTPELQEKIKSHIKRILTTLFFSYIHQRHFSSLNVYTSISGVSERDSIGVIFSKLNTIKMKCASESQDVIDI